MSWFCKSKANMNFLWRYDMMKIWLNAFQNIGIDANHTDVIKWKHFPRYWPFVRGIHRSPVNSPHKGQWRGALVFSLICPWINACVNNREIGDLRRHRAHYDVIVMYYVASVAIIMRRISHQVTRVDNRYGNKEHWGTFFLRFPSTVNAQVMLAMCTEQHIRLMCLFNRFFQKRFCYIGFNTRLLCASCSTLIDSNDNIWRKECQETKNNEINMLPAHCIFVVIMLGNSIDEYGPVNVITMISHIS